jgi:peptidyl-prolyl cis-trans isomerase C
MKFRYPLLCLLSAALSAPLAAEETAAPAAPAVDANQVLMTVNGFEVTPQVFQAYRQLRQRAEPSDPRQAQIMILNELVNILMVSQDAEARELEKKPDNALLADMSKRIAMTEMAVQDVTSSFAVSDEMLQKAYDESFGNQPKEYKARHILVKEEAEARELIAELDKGANFEELAKANSTGPSGPRGGDLGWFSMSTMVKPFADAVAAMDKGSYTKEPVQTQFGWHVILLEDVRDPVPPKMEDVRDQLEAKLKQDALTSYVTALRDKADIKVMESAQPEADAQPEAPKD